MTRDERTEDLRKRRARVYAGGGEAQFEKQHKSGKLTARERLAVLCDPDTFQERNAFVRHRATAFGMDKKEIPGDGVVTGCGLIHGRNAYIASQDFTVHGGTLGEYTATKICEVMDSALKTGHPFIFINDGGGARIQEGVAALDGYGRIFFRNVALSGVVPQITIVAGPCAGGASYSPALTDFIIQVRGTGQMYITGPKVIQEVTGEQITAEELGGADSHARLSGVIHFVADNDQHAFDIAKRLLSFLPSNNTEDPPFVPELREEHLAADPSMEGLVPPDPRAAYDIRTVIYRLVDGGDLLEVHELFAPNIVVGFARINGHTVGIIANQPAHRAGVLDIDASDKAARFVRFCNAFNIPLVTLVDVPGFLPGTEQEYGGIIRHGAKLLFAYSAATVPKITLVVRKAYGGAYIGMCSKSLGADRILAWPSAEIAVMGAEGAVSILNRRELEAAKDPRAEKERLASGYREMFSSPYMAASLGYIDDVIEPSETRATIAAALEILRTKRELRPHKKHGNIPL